ncbi:cell surface protein [Enterococcus termitis]|nr:cell surface protein [Enterococcus termitis]
MVVMCVLFNIEAAAEEMSFSVEAQLPDNQLDKNKTYFDLRVTPGEKEELKVALQNNKDEEVTVQIQANTATTNDNGVIDYGEVKPELDKSLKTPFARIAKVDPEVVLAPKEKKVVTVLVNVPNSSFEGIILGGLYFTQKETDGETKADAGMQIENKFAYVVGVRLSEKDDAIESDLNLLDVAAGQRNYRNVVVATLQNPMARILGQMTVNAQVYAENDLKTAIYTTKQENLNMAPNSNFGFGIKMANKAFKPGKYVMKMTVEADGKTWPFEKAFEITADEAKKFNDEAVDLVEEPNDYLIYIIIGGAILVVIIIGLISWMVYQKRKREAELKRKASKKRKRKNKTNTDKRKKPLD